jgi:outer membrane protein OmpA-like peptidoglycan-associated protein
MNAKLTKRYITLPLIALVLFSTALAGCASMSRTERGAATGAGAGAVIGGVIGRATGNTAKGAVIGAVVGGTAGAVIGAQMDRQAEELEEELEGAEVERVGEGIQVTFDNAILFGFDSSELSSSARANLSDLAASLQEYPNTDVVIVGHTDSVGSDEYNQRLSERRADATGSYLISRGVSPSRVTTLGRGESEPVASNATDMGRSENRRVEIGIFASEEYREQLENQ